MATKATRSRRTTSSRKVKRQMSSAQVHVYATFNNTIVTVTDHQGNTVCWGSAGSAGFKGSRKSTPFAARLATEQVMKTAQSFGIQEVDIIVKGLVQVVSLRSAPCKVWASRLSLFRTLRQFRIMAADRQATPRLSRIREEFNGKIYWSGV